MVGHLIDTGAVNNGRIRTGIKIGTRSPFIKIQPALLNPVKCRCNHFPEFFLIILGIKAKITIESGNIIVFQNSRIKAVCHGPLSTVSDILLRLVKKVCRIKFTIGQVICLLSLHHFIDLAETGMIKVIITGIASQNHKHCCKRQKVCRHTKALFLLFIQPLQYQEKCSIPHKRIKENRPVKLPSGKRRAQELNHIPHRLQVINAIDQAVKNKNDHEKIIPVMENTSCIFLHQIRNIQIKKVNDTYRKHHIHMDAFCVEHPLYKGVPDGRKYLRDCIISCHNR